MVKKYSKMPNYDENRTGKVNWNDKFKNFRPGTKGTDKMKLMDVMDANLPPEDVQKVLNKYVKKYRRDID